MAEEEQKDKGRLAAAMLAGSALTFSSFAIGVPAAFADEGDQSQVTEPAVTESENPAEPDEEVETDTESDDTDGEDAEAEEDTEEENTPSATSNDFSISNVDPSVGVDLDEISPGDSMTATGSDYTPDGDVELALTHVETDDTVDTAEATVDGDGFFSAVLTAPADAETGDYIVTATDVESGESATYDFNVGDDVEDDELPAINLELNETQPGETVNITGENFTPGQDAELRLAALDNPDYDVELDIPTADENGEIDAAVTIPGDAEPGSYSVTVLDIETNDGASVPFTVLEDEADEVTEPALTVDPSVIALDDFIGEVDEEGVGVVHTVEGLEPGAEIDYSVSGPENVEDFSSSETADDDGVAIFSIQGFETSTPDVYLGDYNTVVTFEGEEVTEELDASFEVVQEVGEDPVVDPTIAPDLGEVYAGDSLDVTGSGFTPNGDVTLSWNPEQVIEAAGDGNISTQLPIPEDQEAGDYVLTVVDEASATEVTANFTVVDAVATEPALAINPEEITLEDFIGDPEDGAGVTHTVEGVESGTEISYVVSGPEGVNDFEQSAPVNEDGVSEFAIHGFDVSNPAVYLGDYTTVVTYVDENGETGELSGDFSVVTADGGAPGNGDTPGDADGTGDPVGLNGTDLAQTGATSGQLGLIAGALLVLGGAFVAFANRARLFGRKS